MRDRDVETQVSIFVTPKQILSGGSLAEPLETRIEHRPNWLDCIALNYKPKSPIAKNGKIQPKGEHCH
ncbi:hypothetical protein [Chamaesiphon sp. VAR_69_metabat_338]|uniref:hypothetical protein n=1 Tax=Chamaesiphon sp. VAR_69_metabat_338 TaxID=2964704 RepID=UPI00286DDEE5|nr:hypothetical protein [Chamaesiphon sp. VAR_69_metabat_338]